MYQIIDTTCRMETTSKAHQRKTHRILTQLPMHVIDDNTHMDPLAGK